MSARNINPTDPFVREAAVRTKLNWMRAAVKAGLDQIERGEGLEFATIEELEAEIERIGDAAFVVVRGRPLDSVDRITEDCVSFADVIE